MSVIRLHPRCPTVLLGTVGEYPFALTYKEEDALRILRAVPRDAAFPALKLAIENAIAVLETAGRGHAAVQLSNALNVFRSAGRSGPTGTARPQPGA